MKLTWSAVLVSATLVLGLNTIQLPSASADEKPATKLVKKDLKKGKGKEAKSGCKVEVHYTGWLTNKTKFDSSHDHGDQPFSFTLGKGMVIKGWDEGVAGMKEGGKRKLTIPAEMGYGERATGPIPANSTLIFEVELLKVDECNG